MYSWWTSPSMLTNTINMVFTLDFACLAFLVEEMMQFSTGRTFALFLGHTGKPSFHHQRLATTWSWDRFGLAHRSQCKLIHDHPSALPSGDGTNFTDTSFICNSSRRIFWHVPNAIPTSSATSLIDISRHGWFLAHVPCSPRCGRWTVCLGRAHLQRTGIHFWNGNTTQMCWIDLGRTLRKLLAAFRTFQHQFSPGGNRNLCTHAAELSFPSWDVMHNAGMRSLRGFHRVNAGRYRLLVMQVHLHRVATCPACCHFAAYYSLPEKELDLELNEQSSYVRFWQW